MSVKYLFIKSIELIKTLSDPFFFIYRVFHYANTYVPIGLAKIIYRINMYDIKRSGVGDFLLDTYDGGGQFVHPDCTYYDDQYWLVITPYPYGMDEYENPCIYRGDNYDLLSPPIKPIAVQRKHDRGIHLSDPVFANNSKSLLCFYRESEQIGENEENRIYAIEYNKSTNSWGIPYLILASFDDKILSPAMIYNNVGDLIMYYVSTRDDKYSLVSTNIKNGSSKSPIYKHRVFGIPDGYDLWHIGITKVTDIDPTAEFKDLLAGLFLIKSQSGEGGFRLFEAKCNNYLSDWFVVHEVEIPLDVKKIMAFPYKSCFIPRQNDKIFLSFRDKKKRNRMLIINNTI